jgi:hypothetical protein
VEDKYAIVKDGGGSGGGKDVYTKRFARTKRGFCGERMVAGDMMIQSYSQYVIHGAFLLLHPHPLLPATTDQRQRRMGERQGRTGQRMARAKVTAGREGTEG